MTTRTPSQTSGESRTAVAVEMMVLAVAAIGLGLLAAPGGQHAHGETNDGEIRATS